MVSHFTLFRSDLRQETPGFWLEQAGMVTNLLQKQIWLC